MRTDLKMFSTYIHLVYFLYIVARSLAYPIDRSSSGDNSGHLAPFHNQGAPLYFDTGHQHHQSDFDDYPAGYDGYASYAPHHDHEHYHYPKYKFEYGVHDPHTGDIKKQYEERDGDVVRGYYSLVEPDGWIRIVEYTADAKHGFQAKVHRIPPHPPHHHPPVHHTPPYYNDYPAHHDDDDDGHYYPPVHNPGYYEENDYGSYNVYESEETRYPPAPAPVPYHGDYGSKIRTHDNPDGAEYENSVEDYPFHSNVPYPAYAPPPQSYPSVQDLTSYSSQGDVENPDKLFDKRSPLKRLLKQPINVLQMEEKKDDNVTEATKDAKLAATTTSSSSTLKPDSSKAKDTKSSSTTVSPSTTNKSQHHRTSTEITKSSTEKTTPKSGDVKNKKS